MTTKTLVQDSLATFFKEDSPEAQDIFKKDSSAEINGSTNSRGELPTLISAPIAETNELKAWWRNLRAFFRTGKGGGLPTNKGKPSLLPALISGYDVVRIPFTDYPLWIADEKYDNENEVLGKCTSIATLIDENISALEDESHKETLGQFSHRIIFAISDKLSKEKAPLMSEPLLFNILDELGEKLALKDAEKETFNSAIAKLKNSLPKSGVLLPYSHEVPFQILSSVLTFQRIEKTEGLLSEIQQIKGNLQDILTVELDNRPDAKKIERLESSYDFADSLLDFTALSNVLPDTDSELMSTDRFDRIQKIISTLDGADKLLSSNATILLDKELLDDKSIKWADIFEGCKVTQVANKAGCEEALVEFEAAMSKFSLIIAALRMADLEIKELYDPEVHADFFASFTWRSMSAEEMECVPKTILISTSSKLLSNEFAAFSRLLSSNTPVKILAINNGDDPSYKLNGSESGLTLKFDQELGAFAITHRNTFTLQSTASTPIDLFEGFSDGLDSYSPALFHILVPNPDDGTAPVWTSAAVEGRKFTGFTYNGNVDVKWGSRFSVSSNPQPDKDWPSHQISVMGGDSLDIQFTFADYASLDAKYQGHFLMVPPEYWNEDLVPVADYLNLDNSENYGKVPFIWMIDSENNLQKVATTLPLMLLCKERLDFWQFLQENSGINSFHVEQALESEKLTLQKDADQRIEVLKAEHAKELEEAKELSTAEAMEQLTAVLLDLDTSTMITGTPKTGSSTASENVPETAVTESAEPEVEEAVVEEESLSIEEPWIETPLCTSCNECTDLNDKLFNYDSDKMAFIADPKAGTFAELVTAAEMCPVSIIHPGAPLNPDEPDLTDLVKKAEKYN